MGGTTYRAEQTKTVSKAKAPLGVVHYCCDKKEQLVAAMIEKVIAEQLEALLASVLTENLGTGRAALRISMQEAVTAFSARAAEFPNISS